MSWWDGATSDGTSWIIGSVRVAALSVFLAAVLGKKKMEGTHGGEGKVVRLVRGYRTLLKLSWSQNASKRGPVIKYKVASPTGNKSNLRIGYVEKITHQIVQGGGGDGFRSFFLRRHQSPKCTLSCPLKKKRLKKKREKGRRAKWPDLAVWQPMMDSESDTAGQGCYEGGAARPGN